MKKIVALCVSVCLLFMSVPGVMAIVPPEDAVNPEVMDNNAISEEVAEQIALLFINDYKAFPDISWNENTKISETVVMYHVDGTVSAYTFELAANGEPSGYVVVSAYGDVPNIILEFSDSAIPVYEEMNLSSADTVVYTGVLNYYSEDVYGRLHAVDGTVVARSDVPTPLVNMRSVEYLPAVLQNPVMPTNVTYPITNPITWADAYYDGPFVASEWRNVLELYCSFRTTSSFSGYSGHCTPTAITNALEIVSRYRGYSQISSYPASYIFDQVAHLGINRGYYENPGGTNREDINAYIREAFRLFNIAVSVTTTPVTYERIKAAIDTNNPIHISTYEHTYYGVHGVVGFAYTRLVSESTGYYKSFVKIADGWDYSGRYLDISSLQSDADNWMHRITLP